MSAEVEPSPLQLYTVDEVAALMKVSPRQLYKLVEGRRVPHRKPSGVSIRFAEEDVRKIIDDGYRPVVR